MPGDWELVIPLGGDFGIDPPQYPAVARNAARLIGMLFNSRAHLFPEQCISDNVGYAGAAFRVRLRLASRGALGSEFAGHQSGAYSCICRLPDYMMDGSIAALHHNIRQGSRLLTCKSTHAGGAAARRAGMHRDVGNVFQLSATAMNDILASAHLAERDDRGLPAVDLPFHFITALVSVRLSISVIGTRLPHGVCCRTSPLGLRSRPLIQRWSM